ncbi:hypothetical protein B5S28_g4113 [[Candida] boidinii]|nr:hypothetical protein B5S28_g4113 [[Candida] boidinii]
MTVTAFHSIGNLSLNDSEDSCLETVELVKFDDLYKTIHAFFLENLVGYDDINDQEKSIQIINLKDFMECWRTFNVLPTDQDSITTSGSNNIVSSINGFIGEYLNSLTNLLTFKTTSTQTILQLLSKIQNDNIFHKNVAITTDDEFLDKINILTISNFFISQLCNISAINRQILHSEPLIDLLLSILNSQNDQFGENSILSLSYAKLLESIAIHGMTFKQVELLESICLNDSQLLECFYNIIKESKYSSNVNELILSNNSNIKIPKIKFRDLNKGFTLQMWLKLVDSPLYTPPSLSMSTSSSLIMERYDFILLNDSNNKHTVLKYTIVNDKLCINFINPITKKFESKTFENFSIESNNLYHLVLVHKRVNIKNSSRVDLFVNGDYIQCVNILNPFMYLKDESIFNDGDNDSNDNNNIQNSINSSTITTSTDITTGTTTTNDNVQNSNKNSLLTKSSFQNLRNVLSNTKKNSNNGFGSSIFGISNNNNKNNQTNNGNNRSSDNLKNVEFNLILQGTQSNSILNFNLSIISIMILSSPQSYEWILLSYNLSPKYSGEFQDEYINRFLSPNTHLLMKFKIQEMIDNNGYELLSTELNHYLISSHKNSIFNLLFSNLKSTQLKCSDIVFKLNSKSCKISSYTNNLIVKYSSGSDRWLNENQSVPKLSSKNIIIENFQEQNIIFIKPTHTILDIIYSLGGIHIPLHLIESSTNSKDLLNSIDLLFFILQNEYRSLLEFESKNGYDILATILKKKKKLINVDILDSVLEFVGYNHLSPMNSILLNTSAFKSLITDFEIWKPFNKNKSKSSLEVFKFLLFQFTVFGQDSIYSSYNIVKMSNLGLIKKIIQALQSGVFNEYILTGLHDCLLILVKANPTPETMKLLSLYIVSALSMTHNSLTSEIRNQTSEETLQRKCGLIVLDVIVSVICDPNSIALPPGLNNGDHRLSKLNGMFGEKNRQMGSEVKHLNILNNGKNNNNSSSNLQENNIRFKKIFKHINIRWILLLLSDTNSEVISLSLKLLIKLLTLPNSNGKKIKERKFLQDSLLIGILNTLLQKWWDIEEISVIILCAVFDISYQNLGLQFNLESLSKLLAPHKNNSNDDNNNSKSSKIMIPTMPSFLYFINSMCRSCILDIKENKMESNKDSNVKFIESYISMIHNLNPLIINDFRMNEDITDILIRMKDIKLDSLYDKLLKVQVNGFIKLIKSSENSKKKLMIKIIEEFECDELNSFQFSTTILSGIIRFLKGNLDHIQGDSSYLDDILKIITAYFKSRNYMNWSSNHYLLVAENIGTIIEVIDSSNSKIRKQRSWRDVNDEFFIIFIEFLNLSIVNLMSDNEPNYRNSVKICLTELMFHQSFFFSNQSLSNDLFLTLISDLWKASISVDDDVLSNLSVNCLRTCYMYCSQRFSDVSSDLTNDFQLQVVFTKNFESLLSLNDEEIKSQLLGSNSKLIELVDDLVLREYNKLNNNDDDEHGNSLKDESELMAQVFKRDAICDEKASAIFLKEFQPIKYRIVNIQKKIYNRNIQDHNDDLIYYNSMYQLIIENSPLSKLNKKWLLDSAEGPDRMRKKIVPKIVYSDISTDEKEESSNSEVTTRQELPESVHGSSSNSSSDSLQPVSADNELMDTSSTHSVESHESFEVVNDQNDLEVAPEDQNRKVLRSLYVGDRVHAIVNVTQILGLEAIHSILIIGVSHLYLTSNYFHVLSYDNSSNEIVDIKDAPESELDPYIKFITGHEDKNTNTGGGSKDESDRKSTHTTRSWEMKTLVSVTKRKFLFRNVGLELFFNDGSSILLTCLNKSKASSLFNSLSSRIVNKVKDEDLAEALQVSSNPNLGINYSALTDSLSGSFASNTSSTTSLANKLSQAFSSNLSSHDLSLNATKKWRQGEISNFYYLMILNTIAGRTFNDLTQYPVFPWIIADYTSEELDLEDPKTFRDLSKPMGAQTPVRAMKFKQRYEELEGTDAPLFHYGTHYSTSMIVTSYLIRLEPFVQSYLLLQGGKFDHADRLFYSIPKAWKSSSEENTSDVRELIPEFFYLPDFLINSNNFEFGLLQNGNTINNVELPPWAKNDPKIFIQKNREALESEYVSKHLHEWINLIFGDLQRGSKAVENLNVFHPLCYNGAIDLDKIETERERHVTTGIIHNFGQTPLQIFSKSHPVKNVTTKIDIEFDRLPEFPLLITDNNININSKNSFEVKRIELNSKSSKWMSRDNIRRKSKYLNIKRFMNNTGGLIINGSIYENLHDDEITFVEVLNDFIFATGCKDGTIHVYKYDINVGGSGSSNNNGNLMSRPRPYSKIGGNSSYQNSENMIMAGRNTISRADTGLNSINGDNSNSNGGDMSNDQGDCRVNLVSILRGHRSSIIDIKVSSLYKIFVSLDIEGKIILWDRLKMCKIRDLGEFSDIDYKKFTSVSIDDYTGNIFCCNNNNEVLIYTINGELIIKQKITNDSIYCIESVNFITCDNNDVDINKISHYYFDSDLFVVGTNKSVSIFGLVVNQDSQWEIKLIKKLKISESDIDNDLRINSVKMILKIELNGEGLNVFRCEVIGGDNRGRLIFWKS